MKRETAVSVCLYLAALFACARPAYAEQTYTVSGSDRFSLGAGQIESQITYVGSQTLRARPHGKGTRLSAHVVYARSDGTASRAATATYQIDVLPSGATLDEADGDPDYLAVLNQPFAAELDRGTLNDLRRLHGAIPFEVPSPFSSAPLHGYLRDIPAGAIASHRTAGVSFEADGPMRGRLPDRPDLSLDGQIAMRGKAYYDVQSAILLALDTRVTITGVVSNRANKDPVTIVYARTIRAEPK